MEEELHEFQETFFRDKRAAVLSGRKEAKPEHFRGRMGREEGKRQTGRPGAGTAAKRGSGPS